MQSLRAATADVLSTLVEQGRRRHSRAREFVRHRLLGEPLEVVDPDPRVSSFFRRNVLFHTHIQKSAGTTIVDSLEILFGPNRVHDLRRPEVMPLPRVSPQARGAIHVLTGHFYYGDMDRFFVREPQYIASVRHPVARFFSYYKFVAARPDHPDYGLVEGRSFDEVVLEYAQKRHRAITNPMSRTVTGRELPTTETVIDHVRENYLILAPQDNVDDLLYAFFHVFGKGCRPDIDRRNVGDYHDEPSSRARDIILALNEVDLALYKHACREFESTLGIMIRELMAWKN